MTASGNQAVDESFRVGSDFRTVPVVVPANGGRQLMVLGAPHFVRLAGAATGGRMTMIEGVAPPNSGVPPHKHDHEDEVFHVLSGDAVFTIGGVAHHAAAGATVLAPRQISHTFRAGTEGARLLIVITPAGIERMFAELHELPAGRPDMARVAAICARYGVVFE